MPKFSIVVPAYNAESTLAETLNAALAQTWADWECVIVDDGSTDGTAAIAELYAARDPRIVLRSQNNQGTATAYNLGVRSTSADLMVICSADDILLPGHLQTMGGFIDGNPGCGIFSSNGGYLQGSGRRELVYTGQEWQVERSLSFEEVLGSCFFSVGAVYRRGVFDLVGGYRDGVYGEDYDFWLRAMATGVVHRYTPQPLSLHRISDAQKSADVARVWASNIEAYRNLVEGGWVSADQSDLVESAIQSRRQLIRGYEKEQLVQRRIEALCRPMTTLLGEAPARALTRYAAAVLRRIRF